MNYIARLLPVAQQLKRRSVLLLGPRRTGKSSLIRNEIRADRVFNLLQVDTYRDIISRPSLIRESAKRGDLIVIDEIQKLPNLMDEVHLMIEEYGVRFLLTGSSARKLRRTHTSLMAGRAKTLHLMPFSHAELSHFDLSRRLAFGSLPPVWLSEEPWDELSTYVGEYLRDEIQAEALSRNIEGFSRFLTHAAATNTEIINFESVASDAQVPARTVREYYSVLVDTLLGTLLEPLAKKKGNTRKAVAKSKFYFFDTGVANAILRRKILPEASNEFGKAFEHFIFQELFTYRCYKKTDGTLNFWAIHQGPEVDFVLDGEIAVEVKATQLASEKHFRGLMAFADEHKLKRLIVVSRDQRYRKVGKIEVYPFAHFLNDLWNDKIWK